MRISFLLFCICLVANVSAQDPVVNDVNTIFSKLEQHIQAEFAKLVQDNRSKKEKTEQLIGQIDDQLKTNGTQQKTLQMQKIGYQQQVRDYQAQIDLLEKEKQAMLVDLAKQKQKALEEAKAAKLKTPAQYQASLKTIDLTNTQEVNKKLKRMSQ